MVFTRKVDANGEVERCKARLIIQGFRQRKGEDYFDLFSLTPTHVSLRMLLALKGKMNYVLINSDGKKAFTQADLEETMYVELPEGKAKFGGAVRFLKKCLYGIVQASQNWNFLLVEALLELRLEQSEANPCLFRMIVDGEAVIIIIVHVDDMMVAEEPVAGYAVCIIEGFNEKFPVVNLGEVTKFMGCRIRRNRKTGTLVVDQSLYIGELVERHGTGTNYELPSITKRVKQEGPVPDDYRSMIGGIQWAAIMTRPDTCFAVRELTSSVENPNYDWDLLGTKGHRITFGDFGLYGNGPRDQLIGYTDADYANCKDSRLNISDGVVMFGRGWVDWWSRKQKTVTLSTAEAEYVALCELGEKVMFLKQEYMFMQPL
ncbi:unnamed protein product [Choristocarpus tenellus]